MSELYEKHRKDFEHYLFDEIFPDKGETDDCDRLEGMFEDWINDLDYVDWINCAAKYAESLTQTK